MKELIIVPYHGDEWLPNMQASLEEHADSDEILYVSTGPCVKDRPETCLGVHWPTGALLWVYNNIPEYDRFLLLQDSLTVLSSPLPWFRDQWVGSGAVAWQLFPMDWDSEQQRNMVVSRYTSAPSIGIFGPIFYTDRTSLDTLNELDLLPSEPMNRLEACGTERAWAFAFTQAGMPIIGPHWEVERMQREGIGPLKKTFANRP